MTKLEGDYLEVKRVMRLKNVGNAPIIPGELHFKLFQMFGDKKVAAPVEGFTAKNKQGATLTTKVLTRSEFTDLVVHIWNPVLPGFFYDIETSYRIKFSPSGALFFEMKVPEEETTIPIQSSSADFYLPKNYHITYAPNADVTAEDEYNVLSWTDDVSDYRFEYSRIPLPQMGMRGVNVFWMTIIVILLILFVVKLLVTLPKLKGKPPTHHQQHHQYQQTQGGQW